MSAVADALKLTSTPVFDVKALQEEGQRIVSFSSRIAGPRPRCAMGLPVARKPLALPVSRIIVRPPGKVAVSREPTPSRLSRPG